MIAFSAGVAGAGVAAPHAGQPHLAMWPDTPPRIAANQRGVADRDIVKERVVDATPDRLWTMWTTSAGVGSWLTGETEEEPNAHIELRIGGPFGCDFAPDADPGARGSEGCVILSYIPQRMLSFTWNAPPTIPAEREMRTWVVVEFDPITPTQTLVRLTHTGWPAGGWENGSQWPKAWDYFDRAWGFVFEALAEGVKQQDRSDS